MSGDDEVLEDFALAGIEQRRIDADGRHVAFAGDRHRHHAAAGAALDLRSLKLGLHIGDAALQRLRLLHHLGEVLHQLVPSSLNSSGASLSGPSGAGSGTGRTAVMRAPGKCCITCLTEGCSRTLSIARTSLSRRCAPSGVAPSSSLTATIHTRPVHAFSLRIKSWPSSRGACGSGLISMMPGLKRTSRTCSTRACLSLRSRFASASPTTSSKLFSSGRRGSYGGASFVAERGAGGAGSYCT